MWQNYPSAQVTLCYQMAEHSLSVVSSLLSMLQRSQLVFITESEFNIAGQDLNAYQGLINPGMDALRIVDPVTQVYTYIGRMPRA